MVYSVLQNDDSTLEENQLIQMPVPVICFHINYSVCSSAVAVQKLLTRHY